MINPLTFLVGIFITGILSSKYGLVLLASPVLILVYIYLYCIAANLKLKALYNHFYKKEYSSQSTRASLNRHIIYLVIIIILSFAACFYGHYKGQFYKNESVIKTHMIKNDRIVSGIDANVIDIIQREEGFKLLLKVNRVDGLILGSEKMYLYTDKSYPIGTSLYFKSKILFYEKPLNPGEFNNYLYQANRGVYSYAYADDIEVKSLARKTIKGLIVDTRTKYINSVRRIFSKESAGIIILMLTGNSAFLEDDIREAYSSAGFSHVLCISGLHISIIGLSLFNFLRKRKFAHGPASVITILFLIFYYEFSGGHITCLRAIISLLFILSARAASKRHDPITSLSFAAFIVLVRRPGYLYDVSFLLSFLAGFGIAILGRPLFILEFKTLKKVLSNSLYLKAQSLIKSLIFSIIINLILLPAQIHFFYSFIPYSFIANIILLPLLPLILIGGILAVLVANLSYLLAGGLVYPVECLLWLFKAFCSLISRLSGSRLITGHLTLLKLTIWLIVIICFIIITSRKQRLTFRPFLIFALCYLLVIPGRTKDLTVNFLSVGQGDCCIITKGDRTIMIDGGSSDRKRIYKDVIKQYLNYYGYDKLDMVFLSHSDNDHISSVVESINSKDWQGTCLVLPKLEDYSEYYKLIPKEQIDEAFASVIYAGAGDMLDYEGINFKIMYPDEANNSKSENDTSLVVDINYQGRNLLFVGDIGSQVEPELISSCEKYGLEKIDVLKVGHHGSKNSTSSQMLDYFRPDLSLISVGKDNSYGHPHSDTIKRLEDAGSKILRTDWRGAVRLVIKNGRIIYETYVN